MAGHSQVIIPLGGSIFTDDLLRSLPAADRTLCARYLLASYRAHEIGSATRVARPEAWAHGVVRKRVEVLAGPTAAALRSTMLAQMTKWTSARGVTAGLIGEVAELVTAGRQPDGTTVPVKPAAQLAFRTLLGHTLTAACKPACETCDAIEARDWDFAAMLESLPAGLVLDLHDECVRARILVPLAYPLRDKGFDADLLAAGIYRDVFSEHEQMRIQATVDERTEELRRRGRAAQRDLDFDLTDGGGDEEA
jgi:hypothetical protein